MDCCRVSMNLPPPPPEAPAEAGLMSAGRMRIGDIELFIVDPLFEPFHSSAAESAPDRVLARVLTAESVSLPQQVERLRNHVFRRLHRRRIQFISPHRA